MARDLSIQGGIGRWGELSARALAIVSGYLVYLSRERIGGKRLRAQRSGRAVCRGRRLARLPRFWQPPPPTLCSAMPPLLPLAGPCDLWLTVAQVRDLT